MSFKNYLGVNYEHSTKQELVELCKAMVAAEELSGAEVDTLNALWERGPLEIGDVPSKTGLHELISKGLVTQWSSQEGNYYSVATYLGKTTCRALHYLANIPSLPILKSPVGISIRSNIELYDTVVPKDKPDELVQKKRVIKKSPQIEEPELEEENKDEVAQVQPEKVPFEYRSASTLTLHDPITFLTSEKQMALWSQAAKVAYSIDASYRHISTTGEQHLLSLLDEDVPYSYPNILTLRDVTMLVIWLNNPDKFPMTHVYKLSKVGIIKGDGIETRQYKLTYAGEAFVDLWLKSNELLKVEEGDSEAPEHCRYSLKMSQLTVAILDNSIADYARSFEN